MHKKVKKVLPEDFSITCDTYYPCIFPNQYLKQSPDFLKYNIYFEYSQMLKGICLTKICNEIKISNGHL